MEQERFKEALRQRGLKVTSQRLQVLETIADHPGEHLTAEDIYGLARERVPEIGLATIYRTLQVLVELQVIDKISFDDGFARYELRQAAGEEGLSRHHHHHAICSRCGAVYSFEEDLLDNLEESLLERLGFLVLDHEVKLFGYCKSCREQMKEEDLN